MRIPGEPINTDMSVQFGRDNHGDFRLCVVDSMSHIRIIDLKLSPEEVANLISNRPANGSGQLYQSEKHGKLHEYKHYEFDVAEGRNIASYSGGFEPFRDECFEKIRADGYEPDEVKYNSHNHKRSGSRDYYTFIGRRYV